MVQNHTQPKSESFGSIISSQFPRGVRIGALSLVLAALSGCASEGHDEQVVGSEKEGISADGILVCPSVDTRVTTEDSWYSVPAMNNKFRHFPDFARFAGMTSVNSCAEGRQFMQKYREYNSLVPNFDLYEPYESSNFVAPEPPGEERTRPVARGPKIKDGSGDRLSPVVALHPALDTPDPPPWCTGTFIGRNWILTAAHCLQTAQGWVKGVHPASAAKLNAWHRYDIEFFGAQGRLEHFESYPKVLQYVDSRFTGFEPNNPYAAFDVALLYVHAAEDGYLPNMAPSLGSEFPLMRVSLDADIDVPSATFWGTGLIDDDVVQIQPNGQILNFPQYATDPDPKLRRGNLAAYTAVAYQPEPPRGNPPVPRYVFGGHWKAQFVSGTTVCQGDSGGPLVEPWSIKNPNGTPVTSYVVSGVLSQRLRTPRQCTVDSDCVGVPGFSAAAKCGNNGLCFDVADRCADPGQEILWTPAYVVEDFIRNTVQLWYQHGFNCSTGEREQNTDKFLQCWGKPCLPQRCTEDPAACCGADEYCSRPGNELTACYEGMCPGGGCDCIWGQCLPSK